MVEVASPRDYARSYTFFAPSLEAETDLVVVRSPKSDESFDDVTLDCAGVLSGWTQVGKYQYTRVALSRDNFVPQTYPGGTCDTGVHRIWSSGTFGATLWGWGSAATGMEPSTQGFEYGQPLVGPTHAPANPIEPP